MTQQRNNRGSETADWARTPSAMFAAGVLGVVSLLTIGIALSREFRRDTRIPSMALVSNEAPKPSTTEPQPASNPIPTAVHLIDINRADLAELDLLPGIGPAMGQRIIDYRAENGPFKTIDSIQGVSGIGPRTLEKLRPLVTLGEPSGYTTDN